jgi:hypothetical protein
MNRMMDRVIDLHNQAEIVYQFSLPWPDVSVLLYARNINVGVDLCCIGSSERACCI